MPELKNKINEAVIQLGSLNDEIKIVSSQLGETCKVRDGLLLEIKSLEVEINSLNQVINEKRATSAELEIKVSNLRTKLESLVQQQALIEQGIEALKLNQSSLEKDIKEKSKEIANLTEHLATVKNSFDYRNAQLIDALKELSIVQLELIKTQKTNQVLESEISSKRSTKENLILDIKTLELTLGKLAKRIEAKEAKHRQDIKDEKKTLERRDKDIRIIIARLKKAWGRINPKLPFPKI